MTKAMSYGVREAYESSTELDQALELLSFRGFCTLDSGIDARTLASLKEAFDDGLSNYHGRFGTQYDLKALGEHQTIRVLAKFAPAFVTLIENPPLRAFLQALFGNSVVLNQMNGLINPPKGEQYAQARWHRDLPYQHFVASRPLAINALFCLDDFTVENGATRVAVGSHKEEKFPSAAVLETIAETVTAPAGTFLVLDAMTYHCGGNNLTGTPRRAVNHVFTIPLMRQQISFESAIGGDLDLTEDTRRLLGYGSVEPRTVDEWLEARTRKATENR